MMIARKIKFPITVEFTNFAKLTSFPNINEIMTIKITAIRKSLIFIQNTQGSLPFIAICQPCQLVYYFLYLLRFLQDYHSRSHL